MIWHQAQAKSVVGKLLARQIGERKAFKWRECTCVSCWKMQFLPCPRARIQVGRWVITQWVRKGYMEVYLVLKLVLGLELKMTQL